MSARPNGWWRARVHIPGETPIEIMPQLTNDPDTLREMLRMNYKTATKIEVWEVDRLGNTIEKTDLSQEERAPGVDELPEP